MSEKKIEDYPFKQAGTAYPPNQTKAKMNISKGVKGMFKIDPGLETSSERVSLISTKMANELVQHGAQISTTKKPYHISTSQAASKSTTSNKEITLEIEFDKVKGQRCFIKCIITDLVNYDLIISYRDYACLDLQKWLIESQPLAVLDQGEAEELENISTPQLHHIGGEREKLPEKATDADFRKIVDKMANDLPDEHK